MAEDIYKLFDKIEAKWKQNQETSCINELEKRIARGSTGGEIFSDVIQFFNDLKNKNKEAYLHAKDLIEESLIRYKKFIKQTNKP